MARKTKTQLRIEELEAQRNSLNAEIVKLQRPAELHRAEKLVGRCFKYQNNYSCPETEADYWWMYLKVVAADGGNLKTLRFEADKDGRITIEPDGLYMVNTIERYEEISATEFTGALGLLASTVVDLEHKHA